MSCWALPHAICAEIAGTDMDKRPSSITVWKTFKLGIASTIIAGSLWVGWDHAQALFWKGGPALNGYEFWFTPFIVYILIQLPAAVATMLVRLVFGFRIPSPVLFVVYPVVSTVTLLATGYLSGVNFNYPMMLLVLIAIPKTAIYGLVFASFDRIS
jgi:hypothetical protein